MPIRWPCPSAHHTHHTHHPPPTTTPTRPTTHPCLTTFHASAGATEVRVDSIPTANAGLQRSVHFSVCCVPCGAAVGRLYTQLPQALAPALNLLCLEDACCLSYELGSAEVRAPAGAGGGATAAAVQQQQQQGEALLGVSGALAKAAAASGAAGIDPGLVLELLQRVEQLEATLCTVGKGGCSAGHSWEPDSQRTRQLVQRSVNAPTPICAACRPASGRRVEFFLNLPTADAGYGGHARRTAAWAAGLPGRCGGSHS